MFFLYNTKRAQLYKCYPTAAAVGNAICLGSQMTDSRQHVEITTLPPRAHEKQKIDTYVPKHFFHPSRRGGRVRRPHPPPLRHIISYANNPYSKSYIVKGQRRYYRADTQPPGRAAAACVPATHSAEQRRKKERARESSHNEHSLHGEGTCYNPPSKRLLGYKASAESQPMARTSSAAAGPTSVTI